MSLRSLTVRTYWLSSSCSRCWSWSDFRPSVGTARHQGGVPTPPREATVPLSTPVRGACLGSGPLQWAWPGGADSASVPGPPVSTVTRSLSWGKDGH
jgi:hypothetical protein